jgi:hypothetical protein
VPHQLERIRVNTPRARGGIRQPRSPEHVLPSIASSSQKHASGISGCGSSHSSGLSLANPAKAPGKSPLSLGNRVQGHSWARDYDASAGRWASKDPIRFASEQANLYAYVSNDPVNSVDVTGRVRADVSCTECQAIATAWFVACIGGSICLPPLLDAAAAVTCINGYGELIRQCRPYCEG